MLPSLLAQRPRGLRSAGLVCFAAGLFLGLPVPAVASSAGADAAGSAPLPLEVAAADSGQADSGVTEDAAALGTPQSFSSSDDEVALGTPQSFTADDEVALGTPQSFTQDDGVVLAPPQSFTRDSATGEPEPTEPTEPTEPEPTEPESTEPESTEPAASDASDLAVTLSGPDAGAPGGTGSFVVAVVNQPTAAAPVVGPFTVTVTASNGLEVAGVAAGDGDAWVCVLGPLSCTWHGGLAVGEAAPALVVSVRLGSTAGQGRLVAAVSPGDDEDGALLDDNTATRTVTLSGPADPTPPAADPTEPPAADPTPPAADPTPPAADPTPAPVSTPVASAPALSAAAPAAATQPRAVTPRPAAARPAGSRVAATASTAPTTLAFTGTRTDVALALALSLLLAGVALVAAGRPHRTA